MAVPSQKKSIWNRHIPTLLGLVVLVGALVAGIFLVSSSTDVFSPRATPQTTPKSIQVTNVSDSGFTISFITDEPVAGFVKYGTSPTDLSQQASDDRDQLTGTVGTFTTHHVTLRGLQANTQYYYELGTGSRDTFDNNGEPFSIQTFNRTGTPGAAQTAYGTILDEVGNPATGAMVYVSAPGIGMLSTLVKDSGSWAVPLSNARQTDGSYAEITSLGSLQLSVQGTAPTATLTHTVSLDQTQPVVTLTFGQTPPQTTATDQSDFSSPDPSAETTTEGTATQSSSIALTTTSTSRGGLTDVINSTPGASTDGVLDLVLLDQASASGTLSTPTLNTSTPVIKGTAAPLTKVTITVHSETFIEQEVITDENGNYVLDLTQLQQGLEPGPHTVTYSYIDPNTGQEVTATHNFYVAGSSELIAQANTGTSTTSTSGPFGSGNPYPVGGAPTASSSATPSATTTASASASPVATSSGQATGSGKVTYPATGSGIPVSGSTGTTVALVGGGLFFLLAGTWSYYLAQKAAEEE